MTGFYSRAKNPASSSLHICKVCGKNRSIKSVDHSKCIEILAKKAKERTVKVNINGRECKFSEEQIISGKRRNAAKYHYINGDLPHWMLD